MPVIYVCKNCGHVLYTYEFRQDYYGPRSYRQVARKYNWKCPKCGHQLGFPEIEVRPKGTMIARATLSHKTAINVPKVLASRLEAYTEEKRVSISEVVQKALKEYLKARGWI